MNRLPFRVVLIALLLPFALAVAGIAVMVAWLPQLPSTIVTHWRFDGTPDAFGPGWPLPVLLGAIGIVLPTALGLGIAASFRRSGLTNNHKLLAVISVFVTSMIAILFSGSMAIQLHGVATSNDVIVPILVLALLVSLALVALGWFVMPKGQSVASKIDAVPEVKVAGSEHVVWVGSAHISTVMFTVITVVLVLIIGLVIFAIAVTGLWVFVVIPVVIGVSLLGTASWRVVVEATGLTVRGMLGWPVFRVPVSDVAQAGTSHVVPVGEFGGWGVRFGLGRRLGIITRAGEALEVQRRDGRALVVTVDDAASAAGLLNALAAKTTKKS